MVCLQGSFASCVRSFQVQILNTGGVSNIACRLKPVFQVWHCIAALAAAEAASAEASEEGRRVQVRGQGLWVTVYRRDMNPVMRVRKSRLAG